MLSLSIISFSLFSSTFAIVVPRWAQDPSHPTNNLFRRSGSFPQVGSPTWSSAYPTGTPDVSQLPQSWVDAFNAANNSGKIPNIPPSTNNNGAISYPSGVDPNSASVCNAYFKCRIPGDTWDAPTGNIGIGFDDGPVAYYDDPSNQLYTFLQKNNQMATHFMIGLAILAAPQDFLFAFNMGGDIAVHTYTHPPMSSLTNMELVAQFGWTMQMIYDSTGGYLPKFWRPPYGDMDMRVRAIAMEVFNLSPILWNQDTADWSIATNGTTPQIVAQKLQQWITGPKSPGLIILEHELTNETVGAFMNAYPLMKSNGWDLPSVARIANSQVDNTTGNVWWNAPNGNKGPVASSSFAAEPTNSPAGPGADVTLTGQSSPTQSAGSSPSGSAPSRSSSSSTPKKQVSNGSAGSLKVISTQAFILILLSSFTML